MELADDIIREWRDQFCCAEGDVHPLTNQAVLNYLDRLERSINVLKSDRDNWMRQALAEDERANIANSTKPLNMAKARKALLAIHSELGKFLSGQTLDTSLCLRIKNLINDALAAPPRNCDEGSPKEQYDRYMKFCNSHTKTHGNCITCPALRMGGRCEFTWANFPYEESEVQS